MKLVKAAGTDKRWDFTWSTYQKIQIRGTVILHGGKYHTEAQIRGGYNIARSDPPEQVGETVAFTTDSLDEIPKKLRFIGDLDRLHSILQKVVRAVNWDEEMTVEENL